MKTTVTLGWDSAADNGKREQRTISIRADDGQNSLSASVLVPSPDNSPLESAYILAEMQLRTFVDSVLVEMKNDADKRAKE